MLARKEYARCSAARRAAVERVLPIPLRPAQAIPSFQCHSVLPAPSSCYPHLAHGFFLFPLSHTRFQTRSRLRALQGGVRASSMRGRWRNRWSACPAICLGILDSLVSSFGNRIIVCYRLSSRRLIRLKKTANPTAATARAAPASMAPPTPRTLFPSLSKLPVGL